MHNIMTCIEKAKRKIKHMGFNDEQNDELFNLIELIVSGLNESNVSDVYNDIRKNTKLLIEKNIFTDNDIPKLIEINSDIVPNINTIKLHNNTELDSNRTKSDNDSIELGDNSTELGDNSIELGDNSMELGDNSIESDDFNENISIEI